MIKNQILYLGLSRVELQTLYCCFPVHFKLLEIGGDIFDEPDSLVSAINESLCIFINPKKITPAQLYQLTYEHRDATITSHAAILLFTSSFTKDQIHTVKTKDLFRVDLKARFDRTLRDVVEIIRKATTPCWDGMKHMEANCFNDGWYLVDIETSGTDPLEDEVIALSIGFMTNYEMKGWQTIYIKPSKPISPEIEELTEITNTMLEDGISKEEAIDLLNNLPYKAPMILEREDFFLPFLQSLYRSSGQTFQHPYIALEGLIAIAFGYLLPRKPKSILGPDLYRKYPRVYIHDPYMAELYDLTLAVFEHLKSRYNVNFPGQLHRLYFAEIDCGS